MPNKRLNMNSFTANYKKILKTLIKIESKMNFLNQIPKPRLSDLELISLDLTSEFMGIDSERDLFRKLPCHLSSKIDRSVYNRRKRNLFSQLFDQFMIRRNYANYLISSITGYYIR
ncbi:hypothetical protein KCF3NO3_07240 [Chryseobacterium sp. KCF3-3]